MNNYNTIGRLNSNIYLDLLNKVYEDDSDSSDSAFSHSLDVRLDDEFNAMIKLTKMKKKSMQEQSVPFAEFDEKIVNGLKNEPSHPNSPTSIARDSYKLESDVIDQPVQNENGFGAICVNNNSIIFKKEPTERTPNGSQELTLAVEKSSIIHSDNGTENLQGLNANSSTDESHASEPLGECQTENTTGTDGTQHGVNEQPHNSSDNDEDQEDSSSDALWLFTDSDGNDSAEISGSVSNVFHSTPRQSTTSSFFQWYGLDDDEDDGGNTDQLEDDSNWTDCDSVLTNTLKSPG